MDTNNRVVTVAGRWVGRGGRGFKRDKWWWKRIIKLKYNKNSTTQGIFCSSVLSLVPITDTELPRAKEFPDRKVWHWSPKSFGISWVVRKSLVLMRWLTVGSWTKAGPQKDKTMIRILEVSTFPHQLPDKGEELETELMIDHACVVRPS